MRRVSVAEVLRLALPPGTQVAAGQAGLGRSVTWARVAGTRPLAAGSLDEGELVIFATVPASLAGEGAGRVVSLLVETGAAGLLLVQPAPPALVAAADAAALPVLVAPANARAADLERAIVGLIIDHRAQLRQRADETYQQLTRIALEDRGLGAIVQALADTMGKLVVIEDEYGAVQAAAAPRTPSATDALPPLETVLPELRARVRELPWPGREALRTHALAPVRLPLGATGLVRLVLPIVLRRTLAGFLSIVAGAGAFDELDELTIGPAATVCALEIAKQRAVAETEYRLQADVLEAALTGRFESEMELAARARALGYELEGVHVALVFAFDAEPETAPETLASPPRPAGVRLLDALRRVLATAQRAALLRQQDDRVLLFMAPPEEGAAALAREGELLRLAVAAALDGSPLSVGVGRPYAGIEGLRTAYHEAEEALLIGQALLGGNRTTYFGDLGIRRLLFPLRDSPELRAFYDEFLGALEAYDERHGTELIRTLEGFFAHHGNHVRAAEALHLHRNTLLYRLARIEAISGLNLDDPEVRLAVQVALRLRPLAAARRNAAGGREPGPSSEPRPALALSASDALTAQARPRRAGPAKEDGQVWQPQPHPTAR
ncbi:MAG TPA: helix-turn-helix domain-containing protein [Chloroflexota bacterium]|nr:helix-turn-helix domain-containing protein [Chloroflexota bacterium]